MDGERDRPPASYTTRLMIIALMGGAVGLGWLLSKMSFYDAYYNVSGTVFVVMLAAAVLYIFSFPFLKHLPPMPRLPLPEFVKNAAFIAFNFIMLVASSSGLFSRETFTLSDFVGLAFVAVITILWIRHIKRREDAKYGSDDQPV